MDASALKLRPSDFNYPDPPKSLTTEQREAFIYWRNVYQKHSLEWNADEKDDWLTRVIKHTTEMPGSSRVGTMPNHPAYRSVVRGSCSWPHLVFIDYMYGPRAGESPKLCQILHANFPGFRFPLFKDDWPKEPAPPLQEPLPHAKAQSRPHLPRRAHQSSQKLTWTDDSSDDSHDASDDPMPSYAPMMDTRGDGAAQQAPATGPSLSSIAQPEGTNQEATHAKDVPEHGPHDVQRPTTAAPSADRDVRDKQAASSPDPASGGRDPLNVGSGQDLRRAEEHAEAMDVDFKKWLADDGADSDAPRDNTPSRPITIRAVYLPQTTNTEEFLSPPRRRQGHTNGKGAMNRRDQRTEPSKKIRSQVSDVTPIKASKGMNRGLRKEKDAVEREAGIIGQTPGVSHRNGDRAPAMESLHRNIKKIGDFNAEISLLLDSIKSLSGGGSDGNTDAQPPDADAFRCATMYVLNIEHFARCIMERARDFREQNL